MGHGFPYMYISPPPRFWVLKIQAGSRVGHRVTGNGLSGSPQELGLIIAFRLLVFPEY